eukprot:scaffold5595_cov41-Prasinocladus_malaysianus.AAC.2
MYGYCLKASARRAMTREIPPARTVLSHQMKTRAVSKNVMEDTMYQPRARTMNTYMASLACHTFPSSNNDIDKRSGHACSRNLTCEMPLPSPGSHQTRRNPPCG